MKSRLFSNRYPASAIGSLALALLATSGCKKPQQNTAPASSSSAALSAAPAKPKLHTFRKFGVAFEYPEPYKVEAVSSNPEVYQIAIDHNREPGVLTIRFNPTKPQQAIDIDQVAKIAAMNQGKGAKIEHGKLQVAGKTYEARVVKSKPLNLVTASDTMAVVPLGGINYVILTHTADEDMPKAKRMFDIVLGSLRPDPGSRLPAASASASAKPSPSK